MKIKGLVTIKDSDCYVKADFPLHEEYVCGLNISKIKSILDNSKTKQGKRLYGTNIIVHSPEILRNEKTPVLILKAGIYNNEIKNQILSQINSDTIFWE